MYDFGGVGGGQFILCVILGHFIHNKTTTTKNALALLFMYFQHCCFKNFIISNFKDHNTQK